MKTIVAGSRSIKSLQAVQDAVKASQFEITEVVSGGALGVDLLGEAWAKENEIPIKRFIPDWSRFGKSAGPKRNCEMADYSEALIALWDGESRGTKHMIEEAKRRGLKCFVFDASDGQF